MKSLALLILLLVILFFIAREGPKAVRPRREIEPGWATMRHDGPYYGRRHFTEP